jgi:hypothetical protein
MQATAASKHSYLPKHDASRVPAATSTHPRQQRLDAHIGHADDVFAVLRPIEEGNAVRPLHDGGGRVAEELGLGPQLAADDDVVVDRDKVEGGDGRVVGDLLGDVEAAGAVGVVVPTAENLAQDRVVSGPSLAELRLVVKTNGFLTPEVASFVKSEAQRAKLTLGLDMPPCELLRASVGMLLMTARTHVALEDGQKASFRVWIRPLVKHQVCVG